MTLLRHLAIPAVLLLAAGCSGWGSKSSEYKGAGARASQPLEVPPELPRPHDGRPLLDPDPRARYDHSAYSHRTSTTAAAAAPWRRRSCSNSKVSG